MFYLENDKIGIKSHLESILLYSNQSQKAQNKQKIIEFMN